MFICMQIFWSSRLSKNLMIHTWAESNTFWVMAVVMNYLFIYHVRNILVYFFHSKNFRKNILGTMTQLKTFDSLIYFTSSNGTELCIYFYTLVINLRAFRAKTEILHWCCFNSVSNDLRPNISQKIRTVLDLMLHF